jgi:hypothetical protein
VTTDFRTVPLFQARLSAFDIYKIGLRTCVIFNPAAKGDKARRFRRHLDEFASRCTFKLTAAPNDARRLAKEAVEEGAQVVVAAGGDGTVNEVLNGIGDAAEGFERACLGVLPLGTVNVFARELGLPIKMDAAWQTVLSGRETRIDLPSVQLNQEFLTILCRWLELAWMLGQVELVDWSLKKKVGPLAYVYAGLKALSQHPSTITVTAGSQNLDGAIDTHWQWPALRWKLPAVSGSGLVGWSARYLRVSKSHLVHPIALRTGTTPPPQDSFFPGPGAPRRLLRSPQFERTPIEVDGELLAASRPLFGATSGSTG